MHQKSSITMKTPTSRRITSFRCFVTSMFLLFCIMVCLRVIGQEGKLQSQMTNYYYTLPLPLFGAQEGNVIARPLTKYEKNTSPSWTRSRNENQRITPSHAPLPKTGVCEGKEGVLLILGGDGDAAVGTLFFMYVVNHLIYADQNNLVPWVHMKPVFPCYDPAVHGNATMSFEMLYGARETLIFGNGTLLCNYWNRPNFYPGPLEYPKDGLFSHNFTITGNGLWESYFEPMSGFPPHDPSCKDKPLIPLYSRSRFPGMHVCAPWGVRPWAIPKTPKGLTPDFNNQTYHEWLTPMRKRGADKVGKYFRLLPWIQDLVQGVNPSKKCLSIHIRLTDKGHGRKKAPLELFQQYAEAYVAASRGGDIFIATDDGTILDFVRTNWTIQQLYYQGNAIRSSGSSAIFRTFQNQTHRTNTEGIVDMYSMSLCDFFVHGFSAMAEAAVYIHPELHNRSVNVDVLPKERISVDEFQKLVTIFYA